jgi:hypothetical protein
MNTKTKKIVIASSIIGAIIIVSGTLLIRAKRKKLEKQLEEGSEDILIPAQSTIGQVIFPLKKGAGVNTAEKNAVKVVQRYINARAKVGFFQLISIQEDGIFGPLTEAGLYKLTGLYEVSYSLYKDMYNYLNTVPDYLSKDMSPYSGNIDPNIEKNNLTL